MGAIEGLLRFICIAIIWSRTNAVVYYDCTEALNTLLTKNLSVEEFVTDLEVQSSLLNESEIVVVYTSADCNLFDGQCGGHIAQVIDLLKVANSTLTQQNILALAFSFIVDIPTLNQLDSYWSNVKTIMLSENVCCVNFALPENTTCNDLQNVSDAVWEKLTTPANFMYDQNRTLYIGFGYSESLVGCGKLLPALQHVDIAITYIKFGNTIGVTESLGLFRKRFAFLHKLNTAFVKYRAVQPGKEDLLTYFYPYLNSLGDESHRQLLIKYWHELPFILPLLRSETNQKELLEYPTKSMIAPYLDNILCNRSDGTKWFVPSAMEYFSRYFEQVVLPHSKWNLLKSNALWELYARMSLSNPYTSLKVIVDYSDAFKCSYNWSAVEAAHINLSKQGTVQPFPNIVLKAMVFAISKYSNGSFSANVDVGFANRMASISTIGCLFVSNSFGSLKTSSIDTLVYSCKQINGSFYILKSEIDLHYVSNVNYKNYLLYENFVRSKLEEMKNRRSDILKLQPNVEVFLQLKIKATLYDNEVTAVCNREVLSVHEYFEAITNWAKFNQIPLILGKAFNSMQNRNVGSWFSFLRPRYSPTYKTDVGKFHPSFVIRDFPQGINNWKIDPCIDLHIDQSNLGATYFYNEYLAVIFDTTAINIRENQRVTLEEYEMMLQYILHRFDLVEIVISDNWKDVLMAVNSMVSKNLIESTKSILINSIAPEINTFENIEQYQLFMQNITHNIQGNWSPIKGIHFVFKSDVTDNKNKINKKTGITQTKLLTDLPTNISLSMGFVYSSDDCMHFLLSLLLRNELHSQIDNFLNLIDYLVCKDLLVDVNAFSLGNVFDTHLYLKRVFMQFKPHLEIYIRVEFQVEDTLTAEPERMEEYLTMLSYLKQFGSFYNISYLIVPAFGESGWWNIKNESDLASPNTYEEKYADYAGDEMWRPSLKSVQIRPSVVGPKSNLIILSLIFGLLVIGLGITSVLCIRYKRKTYLSEDDIQRFLHGREQGADDANFRAAVECMKFNAELSILDINIDSQTVLGFGNFGTVYKGTVKGNLAAIKRPNKSCSKTEFKSVLSEVKVLCYVGLHKNVVCFLGAYVKEINKGILFIATEFCSNGSLESFLRTKKQVVTEQNRDTLEATGEDFIHLYDLHRFSTEIAEGMEYISGKKIVHTDLSTRNVLLDDALTCKIGDFGLSRKLYEDTTYVKKTQEALPWKWMAYESLTKREFTLKSDIWSYGVTLWEIYSLGSTPYGELSFETDFAENLRNGLRPPNPQFASNEIYSRLKECWNLDAEQRPAFTELSDFFKSLCSSQYAILPLLETGTI